MQGVDNIHCHKYPNYVCELKLFRLETNLTDISLFSHMQERVIIDVDDAVTDKNPEAIPIDTCIYG